jgi:hypothetical protein
VEAVFIQIGKNRAFKNYREDKLHERYLRQSEITKQAFARFASEQEGDILIIPAQFAFRHRGKSMPYGHETFPVNEFGLGVFAIGCMLLTHPERAQVWEQSHVDCAGDEYAPDADGRFVITPYFGWGSGELRFSKYWVGEDNEQFSSASGFLPQE